MRTLVAVLAVSLVFAPPALAGSQASPEIEDPKGDVDVQHVVDADLLGDEGLAPEELETSADVLRAWIDQETDSSFELNVELADIPDEREVASPLVDVWSHFTVREGEFHVAAQLSTPREGGPTEASFALYEGEARQGDLLGGVDGDEDIVSFRIPKADVRDPGEGDELAGFHVTTHVPGPGAALDYAPGADEESLPAVTEAQALDPTDLPLAEDPMFGDRYVFQSSAEDRSRISLTVTPPSLEVAAGEQGTFAVVVDNGADGPDEVSLTTSNAPAGWSARVQPSTFTVPAQGSATATLAITPADDADGHELVHLHATSDRGADKGAGVSVLAVQNGDSSPSDDSAAGDEGSQAGSPGDGDRDAGSSDGESTEEEGADAGGEAEPSPEDEADEVPLVSPLSLVVVFLAVALVRRRA